MTALQVLVLVANADAGTALLDAKPPSYVTHLRDASFVLKQQGISLPIQYRINVPHTGVENASSEIVYRWEKEFDRGYTAQPPASITDLGDAPRGQTDRSVRDVLLAGPQGNRRYACPSYVRAGDPENFAGVTHSDQADIAARAIMGKRADGTDEVLIFVGHTTSYAMRGKDFNSINRECNTPLYKSADSRDPLTRRNTEWLSTVYTRDGKKVFGFMNNDWRGYNRPTSQRQTSAYFNQNNPRYSDLNIGNESRWWWASLTSAVLEDNARKPHEGFRFPADKAKDLIIASPAMEGSQSEKSKFDPNDPTLDWFNGAGRNGVTGFVHTTNIMKSPANGYYYMMMKRFRNLARGTSRQEANENVGFCLLRASPSASLDLGKSWQGYSEENGYPRNLRIGECDFIFRPDTVFLTQNGDSLQVDSIRHLSYNAYLKKFMMLVKGNVKARSDGELTEVLAILTTSSANLLDWSKDPAQVVMRTDLILSKRALKSDVNTRQSQPGLDVKSEVQYYSMIDHDYRDHVNQMIHDGRLPRSEKEERRNFDITGAQPWIYISLKRSVRENGKWENKAIDVVRFPISIEKK